MNLGLHAIAQQSIALLFGITDYVKGVTFVRPAGLNAATGIFTAAEATAAGSMVVVGYRPIELSDPVERAEKEKVIIRSTDLAAIAAPGPGDYLVEENTNQRRDILAARENDLGGFWLFTVQRSSHEDWGGLTDATTSEDRGDLTAATSIEDTGTLT